MDGRGFGEEGIAGWGNGDGEAGAEGGGIIAVVGGGEVAGSCCGVEHVHLDCMSASWIEG